MAFFSVVVVVFCSEVEDEKPNDEPDHEEAPEPDQGQEARDQDTTTRREGFSQPAAEQVPGGVAAAV